MIFVFKCDNSVTKITSKQSKKYTKGCLVLSCTKNKLHDFNGLQSHTTGSIPVSPTISTKIKYVRNNKDLACKLLKLLSYLKPSIRFWSDFVPKLFRKIRSKTPPKSIKVSSKCLVKFSKVHRDRAGVHRFVSFFYL